MYRQTQTKQADSLISTCFEEKRHRETERKSYIDKKMKTCKHRQADRLISTCFQSEV